MSRHVVDVFGRSNLQPLTIYRRIASLRSESHTATLLSRSTAVRFPHVAAKTTPIRWPRPSMVEITRLGLNRDHRTSFGTPIRFGQICPTLSQQQTRWVSNQDRLGASKDTPGSSSPQRDGEPQPSTLRQAENRANSAETTAASTGSTSKHLLERLPQLHRPSKEEILAAATGFWHRLQLRFKWFSIRSARPFNMEEIFAFMSWIFWGHVLWVVIGTTTFVSLAIWALNTVFAQETLARWVGNYLTKSVGIKVVFESAIVPNWRNGVICFNNVFVSRRPITSKRQRSVSKGSSATAAAEAATLAQVERERQKDGQPLEVDAGDVEDDGNYTQFDVTIETIAVTLSFAKWFNGKGLLRDVEVRGVRGVLDRTSVKPRTGDIDPKSYRREHNTGDFEIDNFKLEDVLLTMYQPNDFRPFQVSVYNCELPRLRKQWLFYDFLSANTMSGSFDNSLFTIHPRQVHSHTGVPLVDGREEEASQWKKHSRIRVDGLKIDHLNRGVEGPFSWIYEGNVDIVADVMIPSDADGSIVKAMSDFYDRMEATVTHAAAQQMGHPPLHPNVINNDDEQTVHRISHDNSLPVAEERRRPDDDRFLVLDIQIHLNDVRASVPLFTRDLSYVNLTLVRPIVAFINSHSHRSSNFIPINCRIVKRQSEFDGSWTVFDCGLLDDLSRETYDAFVRDISDRKQTQRRIKKVGLWAAQIAAQALFIGLAGQLA